MSSAKGNVKRSRPPKHQNKTAFKNSLHDTSKKTKVINGIQVTSCCSRCTEVIEWKIKYKKYKMLTVPKKCIKCEQKAVKHAYMTVCEPCAIKMNICAKCGKKEDVVNKPALTPAEQAAKDSQLQQELKQLTERKRRAFHRMVAQGKVYDGEGTSTISDDVPYDSDDNDSTETEEEAEEIPNNLNLNQVNLGAKTENPLDMAQDTKSSTNDLPAKKATEITEQLQEKDDTSCAS